MFFRLMMMMMLLPVVDSNGALAPSQAAFRCGGLAESGRLQAADFPRLHDGLAGQRYRDRRVGPSGMRARNNGSITAAAAAAAEAAATASRKKSSNKIWLEQQSLMIMPVRTSKHLAPRTFYRRRATPFVPLAQGHGHDAQRGLVCVHSVDALR